MLSLSYQFNQLSAPLKDWSENNILPDPVELSDELACDEDSVCELLATLDVSKSSGPDGISGRMLKHTEASIASSVTHLFNLSIKSGRVSRGWKLSSVVPIPKSKKAHSPANYRPISLLQSIRKTYSSHYS